MNPFSETIELIQHTPMIHFQAGQRGATLRATDLKPKIDKYLWRYLKIRHEDLWEKYGEYLDEKYFIKVASKDKKPSAYQIHIQATPKSYYIPTTSLKRDQDPNKIVNGVLPFLPSGTDQKAVSVLQRTAYFANVENIKKENWSDLRIATLYDNISLTIFSKVPEVKELVVNILPYVLAETNFGTRSSKGFGHFTAKGFGDQAIRKVTPYCFKLNPRRRDPFQEIFEAIGLLYSSLRSGINLSKGGRTVFYIKSLLFSYFRDQGIQWDKKAIKEYFYFPRLQEQQENFHSSDNLPLFYQAPQKHLVRDLMGFSTAQDWLSYKKDKHKRKWGRNTKEDNASPLIERFASPIFFKPVRINGDSFRVYIGAHDIPSGLLNQPFSIESRNIRKDPLTLTTPMTFNVHDYLRFALEDTDWEEQVDEDFHRHPNFKTLSHIIRSIRQNLR